MEYEYREIGLKGLGILGLRGRGMSFLVLYDLQGPLPFMNWRWLYHQRQLGDYRIRVRRVCYFNRLRVPLRGRTLFERKDH